MILVLVFIFAIIVFIVGACHCVAAEKLTSLGIFCSIISIVIVVLGLYIVPKYGVWQQRLVGEAELARAEQNRQILINEAMAKKESAVYWAQAEIERAAGAAEANRIMSESLGTPEDYLRWLYIEKLGEIQNAQIIYLPTEAGMPILEATRILTQQ